jgi:carbon monoxide dehydrogenase subunit G
VIAFQTSIEIDRPPEDVYAVVGDPTTYSRWNSAVRSVEPIDADGYRMVRELPSGVAENHLELIAARSPDLVVIEATDGPTPFTYRYEIHEANGGTELDLDAEVELGGAAALLGPLAARAVKRGVDENLATLKTLLES